MRYVRNEMKLYLMNSFNLFTDDDEVHDQAAKVSDDDADLRHHRAGASERLAHYSRVGCGVAGVRESHQKLDGDFDEESDGDDKSKGRDYAQDF